MAMSQSTVGNDATFELDQFGKPRLCSEAETIKNAVMFILFSKPGCYPSIPKLGMNIRELLYSYYDEIDEQELEARLTEQCSALSGYFDVGSLAIRKLVYRNMPSLLIYIKLDSVDDPRVISPGGKTSNGFYIGLSVDELNELLVNITPSYSDGR